MLELINIAKIYGGGDNAVHALKCVSIKFRKNEFVSVLGPSGCGKTTMLNIVGGLDRYSSGDLLINGKSTKTFKAYDWDAYRNNCVGFVFQNYNLIPHQTVLGNVELALTLSGVSKAERRRKASAALDKVGLSDQKHKRPNQLSGGQMQRVAIARAIVNDPEIILADEPTGALDTATSVQVLDLLKEIAKDRLVIMVTHNSELAKRYSTRIINLIDGNIVGDTNPIVPQGTQVPQIQYSATESRAAKREQKAKMEKTAMSFFTALNLSLKNLLTKKGRSILVSFAGSIGIIGIALVLAISNGFKVYIKKIETETLANFPISISRLGIDLSSLQANPNETERAPEFPKDGTSVGFYEPQSIMDIIGKPNNITKEYVDYIDGIKELKSEKGDYRGMSVALDVQKSYAVHMPLITQYDKTGEIKYVRQGGGNSGSMGLSFMGGGSGANFSEMLDNAEFVLDQYDRIYGEFPSAYNEIALVMDNTNRIDKNLARNLGFNETLTEMDFDKIVGKTYKIILNDEYYVVDEDTGMVTTIESADSEVLDEIFSKPDGQGIIELRISGIMREKQGAVMALYDTGLVYLPSLTQKYLESCANARIATLQSDALKSTETTGLQVYKALFSETDLKESFLEAISFYESMAAMMGDTFLTLPKANQKSAIKSMLTTNEMYEGIDSQTAEEYAEMFIYLGESIADFKNESKTTFGLPLFYFREFLTGGFLSLSSVKDSIMQLLGVGGLPTSIYIYPRSFETKGEIIKYLNAWNTNNPDNKITYTDPAALLSSTMGQMIDIISYVLAAFAGVSLVVSSIMIGIITYVSVMERTKEIGVLRSIGARKKDIGRVFNAETIIIGFIAGLMGIAIAYLLCLPINVIIGALSGSATLGNLAILNPLHAVILIAGSTVLTLLSGLIPSVYASNRDPVAALRSE